MLFREENEDLEVLPFADRAEAGRIIKSSVFKIYTLDACMLPRFAGLNLESGWLNTDEDSGSQLSTSRVRVNGVNVPKVPAGLPIAVDFTPKPW